MAELYYKNSLSLIYTHEGLKQAGGHEEPGHADPHRARRSEPQQQVGEDGKRGGQNQPRTQTSAEWDTCIRSPASIQMELLLHLPTHQGVSFPTLVQGLRPTRYPIRGSDTASQARLTNKIRDTWKASI